MKLFGHNIAFEKCINIVLNYQCILLKVRIMYRQKLH